MQKEYGKLSLAQLREAMQLETLFAKEQREVPAYLRSKPEVWEIVVQNLIPWSPYYDKSMENQLNGFLHAFGLMHDLRSSVASDDPQQAWLDIDKKDEPAGPLTKEMGIAVLKGYGLLIGLANSFDSLRIFGKYLNELVAEGRAGSDKAFFDAIRIDPTVMCTQAFQDRLSRAVIESKAEFFEDLRKALRGKTKMHEHQLNRVRVAIRALLEAGGAEMSDEALYDLFVKKLNIYAPGEDAPKALRKHIRKQKKHTTTKKR